MPKGGGFLATISYSKGDKGARYSTLQALNSLLALLKNGSQLRKALSVYSELVLVADASVL